MTDQKQQNNSSPTLGTASAIGHLLANSIDGLAEAIKSARKGEDTAAKGGVTIKAFVNGFDCMITCRAGGNDEIKSILAGLPDLTAFLLEKGFSPDNFIKTPSQQPEGPPSPPKAEEATQRVQQEQTEARAARGTARTNGNHGQTPQPVPTPSQQASGAIPRQVYELADDEEAFPAENMVVGLFEDGEKYFKIKGGRGSRGKNYGKWGVRMFPEVLQEALHPQGALWDLCDIELEPGQTYDVRGVTAVIKHQPQATPKAKIIRLYRDE